MAQDYTPEGHRHRHPLQSHPLQSHPLQSRPLQGNVPNEHLPAAHIAAGHIPSEKAAHEPRRGRDSVLESALLDDRLVESALLDGVVLDDAEDLSGALDGDADGGIEWGADAALARVLLSAALTEVAPTEVRESVLSAVDAVLREPAAVPAFPADGAPVTTLSGVFEKRKPTTEAASCVEAPPAATIDAAAQHDQHDAEQPHVDQPHADRPDADQLDARQLEGAEHDGRAHERSFTESAPAFESGLLEAPCREAHRDDALLVAAAADTPLADGGLAARVLARAGTVTRSVHCVGGPIVGGRCHGVASGVDGAAPSAAVSAAAVSAAGVSAAGVGAATVAAASVAGAGSSGAAIRRAVSHEAPLASRAAPAGGRVELPVPARAAGTPHLDALRDADVVPSVYPNVAPGSSERWSLERWREGAATSAFNLVQLAAAIVVGIVIGKAAHLLMAEEDARASTPSDDTGALRPEPGRALGAVGIPASTEALDELDAVAPIERQMIERQMIEPQLIERRLSERRLSERRMAEAGVPRQVRRSRSASRARASSRAGGSLRAARAAKAPPAIPCVASAQAPSAALALGPSRRATPPPAAGGLPCETPVATALSGAALASDLQRVQGASPIADGELSLSDDWLGEQLAILGRAERSLLEGDPDAAVRSLDEYRARFPDGLLGPQMASIRQRVEDRFTAFIFP